MTQEEQRMEGFAMSREVPELTSLDSYDAFKNKVHACIYWLIYKAYPTDVPEEFRTPFYIDSQGTEHVKPSIINQLVSAELYCRACSNIFENIEYQWQGHWSVIQILSRKGIYVVDNNDEAVTEGLLIQNAPFKPHAHLALIECIMMAYISEVITVERVAHCVRRFANFNASSELPNNAEDAILFWLNKVCTTVRYRLEREQKLQQQQLLQLPVAQAQRIVPKVVPAISAMQDLMKDLGDGCSLAVVLHFYSPQLLRIEDIAIHENMSFADSIFNLQVVKSFCSTYMSGVFNLVYEDFLYSPVSLKTNILVFLAELFWYLEMKRPEWVQPQGVTVERTADRPEVQKPPASSRMGFTRSRPLSISTATKRSFQSPSPTGPLKASHSNPEINKLVAQASQPLLPRRHVPRHHRHSVHMDQEQQTKQLRRFNSLENMNVKNSTIAWPEVSDSAMYMGKGDKENNGVGVSDLMRSDDSKCSSLLANVSMDSTADDDMTQNWNYKVLHHLYHPWQHHILPWQPQPLKTTEKSKLLPAATKPRKENMQITKKGEERGEILQKKTPSFERLNKNGELCDRTDADSICDSSPDSIPDSIIAEAQPSRSKAKHGEAFFIDTSPTESVTPTVTSSYTISEKHLTAEGAIAAGIPIVSGEFQHGSHHGNPKPEHLQETPPPGYEGRSSVHYGQRNAALQPETKLSVDGSGRQFTVNTETSSDRDRELHKLHNDQTDREDTKKVFLRQFGHAMQRQQQMQSYDEPYIQQSHHQGIDTEGKVPHTACSVANDNFTHTNHIHQDDNRTTHLLNNVVLTDDNSANTTLNHTNMTTWVEHTQHHHPTNHLGSKAESSTVAPVTSELMQIRMKLEEKRRLIEADKKLMERSRSKHRQRMGKAAFLQVLGKKDTAGTPTEIDSRDKTAPRQQQQQQQQQQQPRDEYNTNLEKINANLTQLQGELLRLSQQQEQLRLSQQQEQMKVTRPESPSARPQQQQRQEFWLNQSEDDQRGGSAGFFLQSTTPPGAGTTSRKSWATDQTASKPSNYGTQWSSTPNLSGSRTPHQPMNTYTETSDRYQQPSVTPSKFQPPPSPKFPPSITPSVLPNRYQATSTPSIPSNKYQQATKYDSPVDPRSNYSPSFSVSPSTSTPSNFAYSPFTNKTPSVTGVTQANIASQAVSGYSQTNQPASPIPFTLDQTSSVPSAAVAQQPASSSSVTATVLQPVQQQQQQHPRPYQSSMPQGVAPQEFLPPSVQQQTATQLPVTQQQELQQVQPSKPAVPQQKVLPVETVKPAPVERIPITPLKKETKEVETVPIDVKDIKPETPKPTTVKILSPEKTVVSEIKEVTPVKETTSNDENADDSKVLGFIVGQETTSDNSAAKKKEHFLRSRLKRQEEERAKKALREVELEKKREQQRKKQEELEKKKEEERIRRENIKQQYLKKKQQQQEQEQDGEVKEKERKPRKPRPKSRVLSQHIDDELGSGESLASQTSQASQAGGGSTLNVPLDKGLNTSSPPSLSVTSTDGNSASTSSSTPSLVTANGATQQQHVNVFAEYTGPKLFVKPTTKSNRHLITNAIAHCVLPGAVNKGMKDKILQELAKADAKHFLILFRDSGCQFRALYAYSPETEEITKFHGTGPRQVTSSMIEKIFKYNSGGKHFSVIPSKTMSVSVDAFTIHNHLWQSKKAAAAKKPMPSH
ncbi:LOW QUALITY PROTEIN: calmodulin-regulated spectrin-associated protein 2-like [Ptychodera flava]|uniref:LOW QUALITY PROTEIN: calmodulin-regulated spectrin-associated protein 2-like n=1 Tax=Ptychodera flava TaxID=63121 RepID=UPI00396A0090